MRPVFRFFWIQAFLLSLPDPIFCGFETSQPGIVMLVQSGLPVIFGQQNKP